MRRLAPSVILTSLGAAFALNHKCDALRTAHTSLHLSSILSAACAVDLPLVYSVLRRLTRSVCLISPSLKHTCDAFSCGPLTLLCTVSAGCAVEGQPYGQSADQTHQDQKHTHYNSIGVNPNTQQSFTKIDHGRFHSKTRRDRRSIGTGHDLARRDPFFESCPFGF
jgi:hypothetical protein